MTKKGVPNPKNSKPKVQKTCLYCGKIFIVIPAREHKAKYCSRSCGSKYRTGEISTNWQGGPVEKTCQYCGKAYKVGKASAGKSHYCSNSCTSKASNSGSKSYMWKGGPVGKTCPQCRKSFFANHGDKRRKYCSKQCLDEARTKRITLTCAVCGKQYEEKLSKANRYIRSYCSRECRYVMSSGPTSPTWLGGISFAPYPTTFNDVFKRMIRARDNDTCKVCGKYGNHVHHINYVKMDTTPENCITLCHSCHMKTNANREYWQFIISTQLMMAVPQAGVLPG